MNKRQRKKNEKKHALWNERMVDALRDSGGLQRIAVAMAAPLLYRRDYRSIGRRLLAVEPLPADLPIYDKDIP